MTFELHPNFKTKTVICDLPLCRVLLEDEKNYPWILLVPRRAQIMKIMDLSQVDQLQLLKELDLAQHSMWKEFLPTQLNVAAIGNKTPQLHIHIIARYRSDPAWPNTVWDHPARLKYREDEKSKIVERLTSAFKEPSYTPLKLEVDSSIN